jgi:Helix-turn-helix domain
MAGERPAPREGRRDGDDRGNGQRLDRPQATAWPLPAAAREQANKTVKVASEDLEWSPVKIWRIKSGQVSMRALDVEAMCRKYGATQDVTDALTSLAKETKGQGLVVLIR